MIVFLTRVNMIALMVLVFLSISTGIGESSEITSADVLKRLDEMGQKIHEMEAEIKTLKKQNKELKAELENVGKEQAEPPKAVATNAVKRPPVKLEPVIPEKPFKGGVQVDAEYLRLKANRDAAPYAGKIYGYANSSGSIDAKEETEFDRDDAWRFGISYAAPTGWNGGVKYMHFRTQGEGAIGEAGADNDDVWVNRLDRSLADDVLNFSFDDGVADYAEQELKLEFDIWDVELGHTFSPTDYTALRFFGGLRFIDMDNDSTIKYENREGSNIYRATIDDRLDMNGYGGRIGGTFMWDLWDSGLSINFGSALSLVHADFEAVRQDIYESPTETGFRRVTTDFDSFLPIIDLNFGMKYKYKSFFVEGGYIFSYWFNGDLKHQIGGHDDVDGTTSPYDYEKADLSFHGWTINTGVFF